MRIASLTGGVIVEELVARGHRVIQRQWEEADIAIIPEPDVHKGQLAGFVEWARRTGKPLYYDIDLPEQEYGEKVYHEIVHWVCALEPGATLPVATQPEESHTPKLEIVVPPKKKIPEPKQISKHSREIAPGQVMVFDPIFVRNLTEYEVPPKCEARQKAKQSLIKEIEL